jgi:hypothetical protein
VAVEEPSTTSLGDILGSTLARWTPVGAETTAMIETVIPAAINPDSVPLVLFARCMMELLKAFPPGTKDCPFFFWREIKPGPVKSFVRKNA